MRLSKIEIALMEMCGADIVQCTRLTAPVADCLK